MDDFNVSSLHESKNEWGARLITILTPLIIEGFKSIFEEAIKLCKENGEMDKYLMTFQNFISRIPKWNTSIIEQERKRICDKSGCGYLEELVTCVHIIQLKLLTSMRVGQKQKKIDIAIPKLDDFIHKAYIHVARKIYKCVYLFEINIRPLDTQKNYREIEIIVQECILNTVRESIPVESILRAYLDETVEEDVTEEIKEEFVEDTTNEKEEVEKAEIAKVIEESGIKTTVNDDLNITNISQKTPENRIKFNDNDVYRDIDNNEEIVNAPKTESRLKEISDMRAIQRKLESEDNDDNIKLQIYDQDAQLNKLDIHVIDNPELNLLPDLLIDDIEILN